MLQTSASHPGPVLPLILDNVWRHFWCQNVEKEVTGISQAEARVAAKHPTVHRTENDPAQNVSSVEAENPHLNMFLFKKTGPVLERWAAEEKRPNTRPG